MARFITAWMLGLILLLSLGHAQESVPAVVQQQGMRVEASPRLPLRFAPSERPREANRSSEAGAPDEAPLRLAPPDRAQHEEVRQSGGLASPPEWGHGLLTTALGSLALVLASFFAVIWATRRARPRGLAPLPAEVIESLGRAPLIGRQQMQLIRLGRKLILLNVTPHGAETLTEVTDPVEVDRLASLCQQQRRGSISDSFRQVLSQYGEGPVRGGFLGAVPSPANAVGGKG